MARKLQSTLKRIRKLQGRKFGWDKNLQITRFALRGERTRGGIIQNPRKKLTSSQLKKSYCRI